MSKHRKLFALIVAISVLTLVVLSCINLFALAPAHEQLIIKNTELGAIKIARHLQEVMVANEELSQRAMIPGFQEQARKAVQDFGLMKLKLFAANGETIFSTDNKELGAVNQHDYFLNAVARGEVVTKLVRKHRKSLEAQEVSVNVVETYVPIVSGGRFLGAFEIYLDVTENLHELDHLLRRSNRIMLLVAAGLLLSLLVISWKAMRAIIANEKTEHRIIEQSEELHAKNDELSVINAVSRVLGTSLDTKELLPEILQMVVERLAILRLLRLGGIMLVNGERLELVTHLGHQKSFLAQHKTLTVNDCLCGLAARSGKIVSSSNCLDDQRHTLCHGDMEPHGHIIVPLLSGKRVLGVLYLYLPAGTVVDESSLDLLMSIGAQIGMALDNARLYEQTKLLSLRDPLTGLANRRCLETHLTEAMALADRYQRPLTVAMLDIDYFKRYNDTHGHPAGDKMLAAVAQKLASFCRSVDLAARYGGEEFLLLLQESDLAGAGIVAERLREAIHDELGITVSIGLAQYCAGRNLSEMITAADLALYRAKHNGRNRVECESPARSISPTTGDITPCTDGVR